MPRLSQALASAWSTFGSWPILDYLPWLRIECRVAALRRAGGL